MKSEWFLLDVKLCKYSFVTHHFLLDWRWYSKIYSTVVFPRNKLLWWYYLQGNFAQIIKKGLNCTVAEIISCIKIALQLIMLGTHIFISYSYFSASFGSIMQSCSQLYNVHECLVIY